jgi:hypothetical protein
MWRRGIDIRYVVTASYARRAPSDPELDSAAAHRVRHRPCRPLISPVEFCYAQREKRWSSAK